MNLTLTDTQKLLRESIRGYLRDQHPFSRTRELESSGDYDRELWKYLSEAGYLALGLPEHLGGQGGALEDVAILLEELVRRATVTPFLETMASGIMAARFADESTAKELCQAIIAGAMTVSPAVLETTDSFEQIAASVRGGTLTGVKAFVDYGQFVSHHLVSALEGGEPALFLVDARSNGVRMQASKTIARTPQATVRYDGAQARRVAAPEGLDFLIQAGRSLAAVQCLANAQQALDMTVEYVGVRVQFGRPIGQFQAVQHHCANMASMVAASRFLAYEAVWKLDRGEASAADIAIAKAWASRTSTEVPMMAHQLHGGIGVTEDYDLHFFSRHGKERAVAWGSAEECLRLVADGFQAGAAG